MLLLAAAAIAASTPQGPSPTSAAVQATATVRVISGIRLRLGGENNSSDIPAARDTVFNTGNVQQPAKLIEFQ